MFFAGIKIKNKFGFTLIEGLAVLFVFSVIIVTFFGVFTIGTNQIIEAKNRLVAVSLANEKMETARNLDYINIGTQGGIPQGNLLQYEVVDKNSRDFYVFTNVKYDDDTFDGVMGGDPNDIVPNDHKTVRIKVAWENDIDTIKSIVLVSTFAPPGKETPEGGGTLAINIIDNQGLGVPQASVRIVNHSESIDTTIITDNSGSYSFPSAPAGDDNYEIEVSKDDYYSAMTYPPYPQSSFEPVDEHASVREGDFNMKSIEICQESDITILTQDPFGAAVANVDFDLSGGRKIGNTAVVPPETPSPVYDYNETNLNSGSNGSYEIENRSCGLYTFSPQSISGYEFWKIEPNVESHNKFNISLGGEADEKAVFLDESINSLLVAVVTNDIEKKPIEGASVHLTNSGTGYDATVTTDISGKSYFPTSLPELELGQYDLTVSLTGYQDNASTVNIDNGVLEREEISLSPS